MTYACGVDEQSTRLCVVDERLAELGRQRVGLGDDGFEIVDDDASDNAAEEAPCCVEPRTHLVDRLTKRRVDERQPAAAERHEQRPHRTPLARVALDDRAHAAEVDLRFLAGGGSTTRTVTGRLRQPSSSMTKRRSVA